MKKSAERGPRTDGGHGESLSALLDAIDPETGNLSRAASMNDLMLRFASLLQTHLQPADVVIFIRSKGAAEWTIVHGTWPSPFPVDVPADSRFLLLELVWPVGSTCAVQPLTDGSAIAFVLGARADGKPYSDSDRLGLRLLANMATNAHTALLQRQHRKDLVFSLNHRILQLNSLIDTGIEVSKLDQDTSVNRLALERAASLTNASRGTLTISSDGKTVVHIVFPEGSSHNMPPDERHCVRSTFTFRGVTYDFELRDKESRHGTIPFEDTDELLLGALARQVHAAIENKYLYQQALEKQKIENDMAVAAGIQRRILPKALPDVPGYELAGINIPSRSVGGDYYDCIPLDDGRYVFVMADVAGKGVPAALLVSTFHAYLAAYLEGNFSMVDLVRRLNRVIHEASPDDRFITAFFAFLDPGTGTVETLSAGHNPVYVLKTDGSVLELSTGGLALGMLDIDFPYQSETIVMGPEDRLLLYTDGVTEAGNEKEELYDDIVSLKLFAQNHASLEAGTFIHELVDDIKRFCGTAPQSDDITALCVIRR